MVVVELAAKPGKDLGETTAEQTRGPPIPGLMAKLLTWHEYCYPHVLPCTWSAKEGGAPAQGLGHVAEAAESSSSRDSVHVMPLTRAAYAWDAEEDGAPTQGLGHAAEAAESSGGGASGTDEDSDDVDDCLAAAIEKMEEAKRRGRMQRVSQG
eukprot:1160453-Pelagomonas_calceolata.AAC.3